MLGRVVGVDADVLVGEIGGQKLTGTFALVKVDGDGKLGLLDVTVRGVFVVFRSATAVAADRQLAEGDVDGFRVDVRARVADGGNETSPVGIATGPGGFDQWRMGDRF